MPKAANDFNQTPLGVTLFVCLISQAHHPFKIIDMEAKRAKGAQDIDRLLVKLDGLTDHEIEQRGRDLYNRQYMTSNQRGVHKAHDGDDVYFWKRRFDHAFFEPVNWRESKTKTTIAKARVARIRLIAEMIAGNVADSECWHIPQEDGSTQRLYASFTKGYVVWLEPRDNGGWTFSTAYNVEREKIRVYVKIRGTKKIWCRVKS